MDKSLLIGTLILLSIYFIAGLKKVTNIHNISKGLKTKLKSLSLPLPLPLFLCQITIFLVVILEIFAPLMIVYALFNKQYTSYAYISTILLSVFTILATLLYHFPSDPSQYNYFMKNVSIIGGLIILSNFF